MQTQCSNGSKICSTEVFSLVDRKFEVKSNACIAIHIIFPIGLHMHVLDLTSNFQSTNLKTSVLVHGHQA